MRPILAFLLKVYAAIVAILSAIAFRDGASKVLPYLLVFAFVFSLASFLGQFGMEAKVLKLSLWLRNLLVHLRHARRHGNVVKQPPGSILNRIARTVFRKKTYDQVFVPALRDLQDEYADALHQQRPWVRTLG